MVAKEHFLRMKTKFLALFTATVILLSGCDKENPQEAPAITVPNQEHLNQNVYADENMGKNDVTFTTNGAWTSEITELVKEKSSRAATDWVSIHPSSGDKAGNYTVKLSLTTNYTGEKRTAAINIKCNKQTITITVAQEATTLTGEEPEITNPVTSIELSPTKIYLQPGETETLKAAVYPGDASTKELNWKSSNSQIAYVDNSGTVTAITEGVAEITVSPTMFPDIKATCVVTVTKNDTPDISIPGNYVKGINGVTMVFDPQTAHVIGNKTEMFAERYTIEGGTLGGGGVLKSIKGQGRDMRDPTEHEYFFEGDYLKKMNYLIGPQGDYDSVVGEATFTWEEGNLSLIKKNDNKHTGTISIKFEYSDLQQPEGNLNINLYAGLRDYQTLGPHYYVLFDNNLGKHSKYLISKVIVSKDDDPDYGGSYERTFRYVFYNELVKEIYYTETKNGITKNETKLCDFYYR